MNWLRQSSGGKPRYVRRPRYLAYAVLAVVAIVPLGLAVDGNEVSSFEESAFQAMNGAPGFLYWPLWPFMQLGNLLIVPFAALVALVLRSPRLAGAILAVGALKLLLEDVVKDWVFRERPGSVISDAVLRGDTPSAGQAFVSGHAVIAVGIVIVAYPYLGKRSRIAAWVLVSLVCFGRVYSGAHFPADVIGGGLLGLALGSTLNFFVGIPSRRRHG